MTTRIHLIAFALFCIAIAFYAASWLPGAIAFGFIGLVFEIAAWITIFIKNDAKPSRPEE
jgi:hypothetical protein